MSLKGVKMGLDLSATRELQDDGFIRVDFRCAFGSVDYNSNGTGSATGNPDWYVEARALAGKDHWINNSVLAPYLGVGYRFLFNDARGLSCTVSTCYWGYRRESNYSYLPVGFTLRNKLDNQAHLISSLEYDHLISGKQISRFSDGGFGHSDLTHNQAKGYGLRFSLVYEKDNWAVGPYAHYWSVDDSDIAPEILNGVPTGKYYIEPKNNTIEFGVKIRQQF